MLCQIGFFDMKCQNALNNCKINALQSPLGCLDTSIGYTDMICVSHLSVMALSVLFCLGDQQWGLHNLIWKTPSLVRAQVSHSYSGDEKQNSSGWSLLWIQSDQIFVLPPFECLLLACTAFMFLSLAIVATFQSFFLFSLPVPFSRMCSGCLWSWASRTFMGPERLVFLPWHHLPVGSNSCFETTAIVWLLGVL